MLFQLYSAVAFIQDQEAIHRDIKPENILIDEAGNLVLADFGIAHFKDTSLTQPGELLANRYYYTPEQSKGFDPHNVNFAADVFAVGLITNEIFIGQKPTGGVFEKVSDIYPYLSDVDILIDHMTAQNPSQRVNMSMALNEN